MKITTDVMFASNGEAVLSFFGWPDQNDGTASDGIHLARPGSSFILDRGFSLNDLHPDLYALAVLTNFAPYIKTRLELDVGVSLKFAELVHTELGITIHPVDTRLSARVPTASARDGLAFSGGADSCAALCLMPSETVPIFLRRVKPYFSRHVRSLYREDAALHTCQLVQRDGYDVKICATTAEYVRSRVGFSVEWTSATAAILQADLFDLRSLSFGVIGEEATRIGYPKFDSILQRSLFKNWRPLFEHVGLDLGLPTGGLSEVATSKIVAERVPHWRAQSCIRGAVGAPCMNCPKCFRKTMLEKHVKGEDIAPEFFNMAFGKPVRSHLSADPILHLENIYAYCVHKMRSNDHPVYRMLRHKTESVYRYGGGLDFLERHYTPMLEAMPSFIANSFRDRLRNYVSPMSDREIRSVEQWDLSNIRNSENNMLNFSRMKETLDNGPV